MSANVWFEEVNIGLINEIRNTVKIKNINGDLTPLDANAVIVRKPEEDFKLEVFPCVSIYNKDYKHDPYRYNSAPVRMKDDFDNHMVVFEEPAVPFNLSYQIDFWSKYQTDMDCMTRTWLHKHFRQFNLKVIDDGGKERLLNCITKGSVIKSDLVLNDERLFHSVINLLIWVELDEEMQYNVPMVLHRDINAQQK